MQKDGATDATDARRARQAVERAWRRAKAAGGGRGHLAVGPRERGAPLVRPALSHAMGGSAG